MKMINLMEIAAQMTSGVEEFVETSEWKPDDDCDCEACLNWLFTGGDLWRCNTFEFDGETYVKARVGMRYSRRDEDRPFDRL